jgi:hypothetical protein
MKKENPTTILLIAAIVVLAAIGAHYAGLFAVTGGSDCDDDFLQLGETLGLESTCAMYEVTIDEFSLNGYQVGVTLNRNGYMQSWIFESGDTETFEPSGCDELWTITCDSLWADPQGAQFEICYESTYVCPTPTATFLDSPEITFDGTTAHCRVEIDAGAGQTLATITATTGTTVEAWDGTGWVNGLSKQLNYNVQVQTVDLTWEMVKETNVCICKIWAVNDCDVSTGWADTAYHIYPPIPDVPCPGLSPCTSDLSIFHECCEGNVWSCSYNNYDEQGYRIQWGLWDECTGDCVCDNAEEHQVCNCADTTPPCSGMPTCNADYFTCEACCDGDVWRCWNHYNWEKKTDCVADETCTCTGAECQECSCTPITSGAKIDDSTDTLTTDKSTYNLGETVYMTATGTNIGDETWYGCVDFKAIRPDGSQHFDYRIGGISVPVGASTPVTHSFVLPSSSASGTWTLWSTWVDDDGITHARATMLLGSDETDADQTYIIIGVLLFILILYAALKKRPQTKR